jgi:hypothetical protein
MGLPSSRYARLEQAHTGDLQKRRYTNIAPCRGNPRRAKRLAEGAVRSDLRAGELPGQTFEPGFYPGFALRLALAPKEGPPDAAENGAVLAGDGNVRQLASGHRHRMLAFRIRA